jgi:hypothetical protein
VLPVGAAIGKEPDYLRIHVECQEVVEVFIALSLAAKDIETAVNRVE